MERAASRMVWFSFESLFSNSFAKGPWADGLVTGMHDKRCLPSAVGEPQGAPSKKKRQKQNRVNDNDDDNEYVQGNYLSLVQIMWHGCLSWEVLWQQPQIPPSRNQACPHATTLHPLRPAPYTTLPQEDPPSLGTQVQSDSGTSQLGSPFCTLGLHSILSASEQTYWKVGSGDQAVQDAQGGRALRSWIGGYMPVSEQGVVHPRWHHSSSPGKLPPGVSLI